MSIIVPEELTFQLLFPFIHFDLVTFLEDTQNNNNNKNIYTQNVSYLF